MKFPLFILSLAALSVTAEITPSTEFGDVPPNATLSQVLSGADGATKEYVNSATGGVIRMVSDLDSAKADKTNTYTKAQTEAKIIELSPPTSLEPSTNYTDRATGEVMRVVGTIADEKRDKTDYKTDMFNTFTGEGVSLYQNLTCLVFYASESPAPEKWICILRSGGNDIAALALDDVGDDIDFYQVSIVAHRDTLALTSQIQPPGAYSTVSNAAVNSIQHIVDTNANLIFTITGEGRRFYFTPIRAINPED